MEIEIERGIDDGYSSKENMICVGGNMGSRIYFCYVQMNNVATDSCSSAKESG
jgi:hypothetical protein